MPVENILVSVVMPVHNGESFLRESIDSILNQTHKNFEFIIIDDFSNDQSVEIISSYKDPRITFIQNQSKSGISYTLNRGINIANGKYIARMDCDDICHPQRIEKQILFMEMNINIAICGTQYETFGDNKQKSHLPIESDFILLQLLNGPPFCHPTIIIRNDVLKSNNILYSSNYDHAEEYKLFIDFAMAGFTFHNLSEILLYKRNHNQRVSNIFRQQQKTIGDKIRLEYFSYKFPYLAEAELKAISAATAAPQSFDIFKFNKALKKVFDHEKMNGNKNVHTLIKTIYPYTFYQVNPYLSLKEFAEMMREKYPYKYLRIIDILRFLKKAVLRQKTKYG